MCVCVCRVGGGGGGQTVFISINEIFVCDLMCCWGSSILWRLSLQICETLSAFKETKARTNITAIVKHGNRIFHVFEICHSGLAVLARFSCGAAVQFICVV